MPIAIGRGVVALMLFGVHASVAAPAQAQGVDFRSLMRGVDEMLRQGTQPPPDYRPDYRNPDYRNPDYRTQDYRGPAPPPTSGGSSASASQPDRESVMEMQTHLNALGYEAGPVDGVAGGETRRAIQRFQRVMNLPMTGEVSASTLEALRGAASGRTAPGLHPTQRAGTGDGTAQAGQAPRIQATGMRIAAAPVAGTGSGGVRAIAPIMANGRLLAGYPLVQGRFSKEKVETGTNRYGYARSSFDLALYMDLYVLKHRPDVLKRQDHAREYATRFLTGDLLARYWSGCQYNCSMSRPFDGWAGRNEFEREASYQAFVAEAPTLLGALAPAAPVKAMLVLQVQLQAYDGQAEAFPMNVLGSATLFGTVSPAAPVSADPDFKLPGEVRVSRAEAPALLEPLQVHDRKAYLGLYVSVDKPDWDPSTSRLKAGMTLEAARLYLDPELQRQIHDFDAAARTARQATPVAAPSRLPVVRNPSEQMLGALPSDMESVTRSLLIAGWQANPGLSSNDQVTLLLARSLLPRADQATMIANSRWAGADEFAQDRNRQRFLKEWQPRLFGQAPKLPFRFSVLSLATLGPYDQANQRFPFSFIEFHRSNREPRVITLSTHTLYGNHRITLDQAPPSSLPMSREEAEAFLQRRRNFIADELKRNRQSSGYSSEGRERVVVFRAEIAVESAAPRPSNSPESFAWSGRVMRMELFEDPSLQRVLLDNAAIAAADPVRALEAKRDAALTPPAEMTVSDRRGWDDGALLIAARSAPSRLTAQGWHQAAQATLETERARDQYLRDPSLQWQRPLGPVAPMPWGRFFPEGFAADHGGGLAAGHVEAFRAWTLRRAEAMPSVLWVQIKLNRGTRRTDDPVLRLELAGELDKADPASLQIVKPGIAGIDSIHLRLPEDRQRYRVEMAADEFAALGSAYRAWLRARIKEISAGPGGPVVVVEPERVAMIRSDSKADGAPRHELPVLVGETAAETQAKAANAAAASKAAQATEAAGRLTILGMAPGIPLAEARRMASEHLGAEIRSYVPEPAFELGQKGPPAPHLFDASVLLEKADGTERITLLASRRQAAPVVIAIRRELILAAGAGPSTAEVLAQATAQYGKPEGQPMPQRATWAVRDRPGAGPSTNCRGHGPGNLRNTLWRREQAPKFIEPRYLESEILMQSDVAADGCGVFLRMTDEADRGAASGTRELTFLAIDFGLAAGLLALPAAAAAAPAPLGFAREARDVLGIRPGMTLAEAEKLAKSHLPKAMRLVADGTNPIAPATHRQLASGVLLADPAARESITLFTERDGDVARVVAVLRHIVMPKDNAVTASVLAEATRKYGEPDTRTDRGVYWGVKPRASDGYFSPCVHIGAITEGPWRHGSPWKAAPGTAGPADAPTFQFLGTVLAMRIDPLNPDYPEQLHWRVMSCPAQAGVTFVPVSGDMQSIGQWSIDTGGTAELLERIRTGTATAPPPAAPAATPAVPKIKL